ncbi:hypothetical protein Bacsa_1472 [Phocaeicola salanitronis DSM 18170]|uniref:DUF3868 domain-containing protein n=1 Tax=Phocaeicola salanitronis (strain DSM 18170 / JCM 13657 / CCUG 60908 / BL78) TaxID=667015 RepID=F0QZ15_PHOSB|nr:DUF3868 domain-containing protein [Phocaeicola salanitronis]ADY36044.1 hypothetical protein Bacsa_1472 [Phocaeicola salanitronis DSM 18170]
MKAKLFFSLLLSLYIIGVNAQRILNGQIEIKDLNIARNEGNLFLSMRMDVTALDVKSDEEIILTPALKSSEETFVNLPAVRINGRNRYYHHLRNDKLADEPYFYRTGKVDEIHYQAMTPYAEWMDNASVVMGEDLCGCCSELLMNNDDLLTQLDMAPKVFEPLFVYVQPEVETVKTRNVKGSAFIDFPVNQTVIYPEYRNNPSELKKIQQTIDVVKNDPDTKITAISIKGYASPEGSYANNTRLAKGRTEALKKYVQELYHFDPSIFTTAYEPEDWEGLERYVEASDLADKEGILDLIAGDEEPDRKDASIKRRYPDTYAFLLKNCYPALRHSDYTVEYIVRSYTDVEEAKRIMKTAPGKLSLQEFYTIANTYESGTPAYNEVFETAVRMYPDDETANLNAANVAMNKRDLTAARKYLDKAGTSKEAEYARGVLEALEGNYAEAQPHLQKAKEMGVTEANDCLKQIEEITK